MSRDRCTSSQFHGNDGLWRLVSGYGGTSGRLLSGYGGTRWRLLSGYGGTRWRQALVWLWRLGSKSGIAPLDNMATQPFRADSLSIAQQKVGDVRINCVLEKSPCQSTRPLLKSYFVLDSIPTLLRIQTSSRKTAAKPRWRKYRVRGRPRAPEPLGLRPPTISVRII